jgi:predicted unusual protein kinase regulating ubiquinone biosynthesis (AarF/ABC1/UbiB family)
MKAHRVVTVHRADPAEPTNSLLDEHATASDDASVLRPLPRRRITHSIDQLHVALPRARRVVFRAGSMRAIGRLMVWLWGFVRFYLGNAVDFLMRRGSVQARAARLRRVFEGAGPTFAKLAQQLSMRADMLPYAYCAELSKMLDRAATFPTSEAIEIIERNLGRPLSDVFEAFDPEPIGSASLACVYQAKLKTGERVAVKVRRPGIGPLVAADLKALDWILIVGETLTIIAPGATRAFRQEFENILFNEMNFRAEARYTDIFRRRAAKRKKGVTAPKVYFDYCTEEVMVSEFVSGVWMWELMAAVDRNDQEFLARVREISIDPKALARKLVGIMQQEVQEELFFHADPHPANLVVMPNNKLCFLDFGAIGRFTTQTKKTMREFQHHMIKGDIGRMVNCSLSLLGPLPPMDVDGVRRDLENIYADLVYAMNSEDAEWWEKSMAQGWLRSMEVARKYSIPAGGDTIQFFRTTFAYDAVIMRLDPGLNVTKEWETYAKRVASEARKRMQKSLRERWRGPTDMDYLQMEQIGDTIEQFAFKLQRNVENPIVQFRNIVGKIAYIASLILKLGYLVAAAVGLGLIADAVSRRWFDYQIDWASIIERATTFGWIQLGLIAVLLVVIRRIIIRLNLPDTRLPER